LEDLIIYKDENDSKQTIYAEIITIGASVLTFKTSHSNIITIPLSRVIKIKQKGALQDE